MNATAEMTQHSGVAFRLSWQTKRLLHVLGLGLCFVSVCGVRSRPILQLGGLDNVLYISCGDQVLKTLNPNCCDREEGT